MDYAFVGRCEALRWALADTVLVGSAERVTCWGAVPARSEPTYRALLGPDRVAWVPADDLETVVVASLPDLDVVCRHNLGKRVTGLTWGPGASVLALHGSSLSWLEGATSTPLSLGVVPVFVATSPDARRLAVGQRNGRVMRFDLAKCGPVGGPLKGLRAEVSGLVWSADGRWLLGSGGSKLVAWPAGGGKARTLGQWSEGAQVVACQGGIVVVVGRMKVLQGIDAETGDVRWSRAHRGPVHVEGASVLHAHGGLVERVDVATGDVLAEAALPAILDVVASSGVQLAAVLHMGEVVEHYTLGD